MASARRAGSSRRSISRCRRWNWASASASAASARDCGSSTPPPLRPQCLRTLQGHSGGVLRHDGEECGYVLEGCLELVVDNETHILNPGDSFFFNSDRPHSYRNPGKVTTRVIWINTPPTY